MLITVSEYAKRNHTCASTVNRDIRRGRFWTAVKPGRDRLIDDRGGR